MYTKMQIPVAGDDHIWYTLDVCKGLKKVRLKRLLKCMTPLFSGIWVRRGQRHSCCNNLYVGMCMLAFDLMHVTFHKKCI